MTHLDLVTYHVGQALVHLYRAMIASEGDDETSLEVWRRLDDITISLTDLRKELSDD